MHLPYGSIEGTTLNATFSTADFSVATVIAGIREHLDMFEEMGIDFMGVATDVPSTAPIGPRPLNIVATFNYRGVGDAEGALKRVYAMLWKGIIANFPDELEWSEAKSNYAEFVAAQAEMLRAQSETK